MKENFFTALRLTFVCMIFFCCAYTGLVTGLFALTPHKGMGELIQFNDKTFYAQVGQSFTADKYFSSRPSAVNYNAAASGGSNKSPVGKEFMFIAKQRIDTLLKHNPTVQVRDIPEDLIMASSSGLDPHISVQAALIQVPRIAKERKLAEANLQQLILANIEKPALGFFGPEKINVLKLNIALDNLR